MRNKRKTGQNRTNTKFNVNQVQSMNFEVQSSSKWLFSLTHLVSCPLASLSVSWFCSAIWFPMSSGMTATIIRAIVNQRTANVTHVEVRGFKESQLDMQVLKGLLSTCLRWEIQYNTFYDLPGCLRWKDCNYEQSVSVPTKKGTSIS